MRRALPAPMPLVSLLALLGSSVALCLAGCHPDTGARVASPEGLAAPIEWSAEERAREVAVRTLRATDAASFHVVRLRVAEKPHVHDRSDLTVFVLEGEVNMHFGDEVVTVDAGDVVEIPRGAPHWAENVAGEPSLAYVIFTPAFDGKDRRPVE